jgi:hypothetical protein
MMRAGLALCVVVVVSACAGSNSTGPHASSPIAFIAGNGQTDTISAQLAQALVLRVRPDNGLSPDGHIVQFQSVFDSLGVEAYVEDETSEYPNYFAAETTSTVGQVSVIVVLGTHTGKARLVIRVPDFGYVDTATFTVTPGHAAGIRAFPADTAAYPSGTVKLRSVAIDRQGNARTDAVTYSLLSGPASLSGSTVTVTGIGRVLVLGTVNGVHDTSYVSGVPTGRVAASLDNDSGIVAFNMDGSGYTLLTPTPAGTVKWAPSGTSLVFDQLQCNGTCGGSGRLLVLNGSTVVTVDTTPGVFDGWPEYSRDGAWIYYTKSYTLWRAKPDGSVDSLIPTAQYDAVAFPSASPDGSKVAYVQGGGGHLRILFLANDSTVDLGVTAESAVWSPTGNAIAYNAGSYIQGAGGLAVINADGSGQRSYPMPANDAYTMQFDWSPDGQWLIARDGQSAKLTLINVASGLRLPLGYTGSVGGATWH